jgi:hypothetical protein
VLSPSIIALFWLFSYSFKENPYQIHVPFLIVMVKYVLDLTIFHIKLLGGHPK